MESRAKEKKNHIVFLRFSALLGNWSLHVYLYLSISLYPLCFNLYLFMCSYSCHHFFVIITTIRFSLLLFVFEENQKKGKRTRAREREYERKERTRRRITKRTVQFHRSLLLVRLPTIIGMKMLPRW